jgi:transcriptional regulator with XRE-family HTH domain
MDVIVRVAKNVRLKRILAGMTQQELATRMSDQTGSRWAQPQVSDIEHGKAAVTLMTLEKLAAALEVTVAELIQIPRARDIAKLGKKAELISRSSEARG